MAETAAQKTEREAKAVADQKVIDDKLAKEKQAVKDAEAKLAKEKQDVIDAQKVIDDKAEADKLAQEEADKEEAARLAQEAQDEIDAHNAAEEEHECPECGSSNTTLRPSGYFQCHEKECNFLDRSCDEE